MQLLTKDNYKQFLKRFGGFDGAIIEGIEIAKRGNSDTNTVSITLRTVDLENLPPDQEGYPDEVYVNILLSRWTEFRFYEPESGLNTILNYEIDCIYKESRWYLNFAPLTTPGWDDGIEDISVFRQSDMYVGGNELVWKMLEI